jgi:hypothetical protein
MAAARAAVPRHLLLSQWGDAAASCELSGRPALRRPEFFAKQHPCVIDGRTLYELAVRAYFGTAIDKAQLLQPFGNLPVAEAGQLAHQVATING